MKRVVIGFFLAVLLAAIHAPAPAAADQGWRLDLSSYPHMPARFVGVHKDAQKLFLFQHKSPVKLSGEYQCTTGQIPGDKKIRGDLRTPEGVYFIKRLRTDVGFKLYGGKAFTLNFPNPVDVLKGKTGSGIWIHGRGADIVPRETKGCVAMNNADLAAVEEHLAPGTPVAIARQLHWADKDAALAEDQDAQSRALAAGVQAWAKAWSDRSDDFFRFYDAEKFARTTHTPFGRFKRRKQSIFRNLKWIEVLVDDVRALPGPDYWVTWFHQYYRTPRMASEGVKRFYWQRDAEGQWRIVGREWQRRKLGMADAYLARAKDQALPVIEEWRTAWLAGELDAYADFYAPNAAQGARRGRKAIRRHKEQTWEQAAPSRIDLTDFDVRLDKRGLAIRFVQRYHNARGYADVGRKTLIMEPDGEGSWRILHEDWKAL